MRKLLVNALNCITGGRKRHLYILPRGENQHWTVLHTKMFVYWEWSCIKLVSQCGSSICKRTAGIVLQKATKPTDPPAFPRNSCCLAYSFWLWSLKRVHRGATGSDFPPHLLLQRKKRVWSSPLKPLQTKLDHKQTHITLKMYTHKNHHLPNSWD